MKMTGTCSKCQSDKVAMITSEFGTYNQIKIDLFGFANLTRYICTACGYMEQYVGSEKALRSLRSKARPGKKT